MEATRSIPTASGTIPVLGHVIALARDPLTFLNSLPAQGDVVQVRLGPFRVAIVCDPELTVRMLRDNRTFDRGGPLIDRAREVVGDGLGSCPRDAHHRQRRLAQPAFHRDRLAGYAESTSAIISEVTGSWRDRQVLDVLAEMMTIASKSLTTTMFSNALPAAGQSRLLRDVSTVFDGFYQRMLMPAFVRRLPLPGNRAYGKAHARLRHTIDQFIAERRANGTDQGDLLSALLAARDTETDGQGLTGTELADTILTFFLAGTETTATTVSWALHLLAGHPDVEQQLHAEVDSVLAGRTATHADLPKLESCRRIINETLRLYPPGWFFTRTVSAGTELGGYVLPSATTVAYSPYLIHHRQDLYDRPESFEPERWDPERHLQPSRDSFIPFGAGAHKCIGDAFGMNQAVLVLASIAARWRMESVDGEKVRPTLGMSLHPNRLRMRAISRGLG
jgi:cytochrome P450